MDLDYLAESESDSETENEGANEGGGNAGNANASTNEANQKNKNEVFFSDENTVETLNHLNTQIVTIY